MKSWMWLVLALFLFLVGGYALKKSSTSVKAPAQESLTPPEIPSLAPPSGEAPNGAPVPMQNIPMPRQEDFPGNPTPPPQYPEAQENNPGFPDPQELDQWNPSNAPPPPPPPPPPADGPEFFDGGAIEQPRYFDGDPEVPPAFEPPPPLEDDEAFIPPPMPLEPAEEPEFPADR